MKSPGEKAKNPQIQRSQHPFFSKRGENSFFGQTGVQAKIEVGEAGDAFEQEADAVAEKVVAQTGSETKEKSDGEKIQSKPIAESISPIVRRKQDDEETKVQKKEEGHSAQIAPASVEKGISESHGSGSPMPGKVKDEMESGFGADFSGVRVHTDSRAEKMNQDLGAQAFAHGNDIYFNRNKFNPNSNEGKKLLAHELTHTVQQGGSDVKKKKIQKGDDTSGSSTYKSKTGKGEVERNGNTFKLKVASMRLPDFKVPFTKTPFTLPKEERANQQIAIWEGQFASSDSIKKHVKDKIGEAPQPIISGKSSYAFKLKDGGGETSYVIGDADQIKQTMLRPFWDLNGKRQSFHVDHKQEYQLGGSDDDPKNLWLLEAKVNVASGDKIKTEKYLKIQELMDEAHDDGGFWQAGTPDAKTIKNSPRYDIRFLAVEGGLNVGFKDEKKYTETEIRQGKPLGGLTPLSKSEIKKMGFDNDKQILLFSRSDGGTVNKIDYERGGQKDIDLGWGVNVRALKINVNRDAENIIGGGSSVTGKIFKNDGKKIRFVHDFEFTFPVKPVGTLPNTGFIDQSQLRNQFKDELELAGLSPIALDEAQFEEEKGLVARGKVLPSVPFLKDANIDIVMSGEDIYLEKVFNIEQIKIPKPFSITDCSLAVRLGTKGLEIQGGVDFEIEKVGKGSVEGFINTKSEAGIKGSFEFDTKLFTKAKISIGYENDKFKAEGELAIGKDKIKGIKKADANVKFENETLTAAGSADLDVKGLEKGTMSLKYNKEVLEVGGEFTLSNDIPRIKGGKVNAKVVKKGDEYEVSAGGSAEIDLPGFKETTLAVEYVNGAITVESTLQYEKGIAKGSIKVGATNRPTDENGNPAGEPGDKWVVYGNGELTLKLTPWLQASAKVTLTKAGEMEVSGTIGIPNALEVFKAKTINQPLLKFPTLEIPLLAIPLGPVSLGLVATIGGGIDFNASIGPGKLEQLSATINYKPGQEDSISLSGKGKFVVPAEAMLRVYGRAGIGLSAAVASVSGGIEVGAGIGIKGAAEASLDVGWTPQDGISLHAQGEVYVEPALNFDVKLFLQAHIPFYTKEWTKTLGQRQFGSGMKFGLLFPIDYKEGKDFNISMEDLKVIKPDLDLSSVIDNFKHELFD